MRLPLTFLLSACLATAALAQDSDQTAQPPATGQPSNITIEPIQPKALPVPDGPVVHREEREGGLIIEDIKIGDGYEVKPGGAVVMHYHGTLKEGGKVFDSSFERGEPIAFPLSGLITGWQKGVPGMKVGGIRRLIIPAALGYGPQAQGEIPPNSDLVFVVQLMDALQVEDLQVGDGEEAFGQFVAVTAYSIKDKDGKEIEKADAANPYIWIPGEFQPMQAGLEGMKRGGKRRITVPKEFNHTHPQFNPNNRPQEVPLVIEVELLALRNLLPRR